MIAALQLGDLGPDRLHDSGRLVPEDGRRRKRIVAVDEVKIAVTDTRGDRAHQDLAPQRPVDVDVLDRERLLRTVEHGSFHERLLARVLDVLIPGHTATSRGHPPREAEHDDRSPDTWRLSGAR
jgi:hypothetical protein